MKEFRKCRAELEAELGRLQQALADSEQEHQRSLQTLEQRFFEEKVSPYHLTGITVSLSEGR